MLELKLYHVDKRGPSCKVHPTNTSRWRHNGRDAVSNHQRLYCLLSCLFRHRSKKTLKLRVTGLCAGIHRWPVNSPHKGLVTRKMSPFDGVIMVYTLLWCFALLWLHCSDPCGLFTGTIMMTSSNGTFSALLAICAGNSHRWIPLTKASDMELWCFLWSAPE